MPFFVRLLVTIIGITCALATGCAGGGGSNVSAGDSGRPAEPAVRDLSNVLGLRAAFNADRGKPRLLLILSPTWGVCRAGASWVRDSILAKQPRAELAAYVVWLPMLGPDTRSAVEPDLLSDPRVRQFWDEDRVVGRWLADAGVGGVVYSSVVWDAFYVFPASASWNERPAPVRAFGSPVISETGTLERALGPLLH